MCTAPPPHTARHQAAHDVDASRSHRLTDSLTSSRSLPPARVVRSQRIVGLVSAAICAHTCMHARKAMRDRQCRRHLHHPTRACMRAAARRVHTAVAGVDVCTLYTSQAKDVFAA